MRWRSRSMSSTFTFTVSPIVRISDGWLTCDQESSEMWIKPSIPSRSTNAPKSTMFEICPSTTRPGCRRSRICWRTSLRSSSSTARRESTTLLRERLSSITFVSIFVPMYSSRFGTRRMSTSEAGRKPRTPRSMIRPPLTTSITVPSTGSPDSAAVSMRFHAFSKRAPLRHDQATVLVLLGHDDRVDLLAEVHLVFGIDRLADRQLVGRDDALGLVADVDEHLVLVDPDDVTGDYLALLDRAEGRLVVGHDRAVDLQQEAVRPLDHASLRILHHRLHRRSLAQRQRSRPYHCPVDACSSDDAGGGAHSAGARLRRLGVRRELRRLGDRP